MHSSCGEGKITGVDRASEEISLLYNNDEDFEYTFEGALEARLALAKLKLAPAKPAAAASPAATQSSPAKGDGEGEDPAEHEEASSGFAKGEKLTHAKRGAGKVIGFFGEFVCVQFEGEPHGQHKYSHQKVQRALTIVGFEP